MINSTSPFIKNVFGYFLLHHGLVQTHKEKVSELDYVAHSSAFKSCTTSVHNMSAHQLPLYHKLQLVSSTAWTALVTWYTHHKIAHTKIFYSPYYTLFLSNSILERNENKGPHFMKYRTYFTKRCLYIIRTKFEAMITKRKKSLLSWYFTRKCWNFFFKM